MESIKETTGQLLETGQNNDSDNAYLILIFNVNMNKLEKNICGS